MTATAPINRQMQPVEWILLLTLSLVWAGSFLINGIVVRELPVFTIVVGRVAIAAMILLLVLRWRGESRPRDPAVWWAFLVMGFLNNVLPFSLIVWGQGHISSGQASILNAMTPIFTVITAHLLTRDEKMPPGRIAGILVGFAGVAVMLGAEIRAVTGITLAAQCALLGATVCYAVAVVFGRRFRSLAVSPMMTATGQLKMASLILLLAGTLLLLQSFQNTTGQGPEGLESRPIQFLLLTQGGKLANQPVMFPVKPLTVRTLTGLFRHRSPHSFSVHYGTC